MLLCPHVAEKHKEDIIEVAYKYFDLSTDSAIPDLVLCHDCIKSILKQLEDMKWFR